MPLTVNTNTSATTASFQLSAANDSLRKSLARLSSGNRIVSPADDAGGFAVASKMRSRLTRVERVGENLQNSISFLQVQEGALRVAGSILTRMSELKTMSMDVTKNAGDIENYNKEFMELWNQLGQMSKDKFNGISLFTDVSVPDHALQCITKENGKTSEVVSLARNFLFGKSVFGESVRYGEERYQIIENASAISWDAARQDAIAKGGHLATVTSLEEWDAMVSILSGAQMLGTYLGGFQLPSSSEPSGGWGWVTGEQWLFTKWNPGEPNDNVDDSDYLSIWHLGNPVDPTWNDDPGLDYTKYILEKDNYSLYSFNQEDFTGMIEDVADALAQNGTEQQRLKLEIEGLRVNQVNLEAAHGRIMDADIALESTRFARQNVLVQSSAAMVAQANQLTNLALNLLPT
jgi:flagellin-like hook-associated protein FlgL